MPGIVVVGLQYGDEGKGKVIDYIAEKADMVVRYSGGNNAGHTVVHEGKEYKLHLIPSGILHPGVTCVLGNGVVIDLDIMIQELESLEAKGIDIGRLLISNRAHVILPIHRTLDGLSEEKRGKNKIGTTGRGIGPVYTDKIARFGIRIADLADSDLTHLVATQLHMHDRGPRFAAEIALKLKNQWERIKPFVTDTSCIINEALDDDKLVLFEGAQGLLIDVDHGTYPYVTSSNSCAGNACVGSGIGPTRIDAVIGVAKAYTTRVGAGPFPTKITGVLADKLRENGGEYGTTTGRPRDCGWLDIVALKHAIRANGITHLAITKLDVLSSLEKIAACFRYKDCKDSCFPASSKELERAEPVYIEYTGWQSDISKCTTWEKLPATAQSYVQFIQKMCGHIPLSHIGVGQERNQIIDMSLI